MDASVEYARARERSPSEKPDVSRSRVDESAARIVRLASALLRFSSAVVCLQDAEGGWHACPSGTSFPLTEDELPTFCERACASGLLVERELMPGFLLVGRRLTTGDGVEAGVLCLADAEARSFSTGDQAILEDLAFTFAGDLARATVGFSERSLFPSSPDPMWVYDSETLDFLAVNEAALERYGYSKDEFLKLRLTDIRPAEDVPTLLQTIGESTAKSGYRWEWRHCTRDGKAFDVEVTSFPTRYHGRAARLVVARDVSERKEAERALHEAEALFRGLVEHSVAGITIVQDNRFAYVNPRLADMLGYTTDELQALDSAYEVIHPDDRALVADGVAQRLRGEHPYMTYGVRYLRRSGEVLHTEVHGGAIAYQGRPAIMSTVIDTTAQMEARRVVEQVSRRNQMIMDHSVDLICVIDEAGRFVHLSAACEPILGYTASELIGRAYRELAHPDERAATEMIVRRVIAGDPDIRHFENRFVRKDGRVVDLMWSCAWSDEDQFVFAVAREITGVKQAAAALLESEERNRATLEALPDLMFRLSGTGEYLQVHAPDPTRLAAPAEMIRGRNLRDILPPDLAARYLDAIARTLETGTVQTLEYSLAAADGTLRHMDARLAVSSRDEVVVIARDVTERKQYEDGLIAAREQAEEMSRLKSAFLANMSHEIRTPLTSIIGFADLLGETVSGEGREFAELIQSAGRRLLDTINSVLDLAQLESGTLHLRPERMDLVRETREVLDLFRTRAARRGLSLEFHAAEASLPGVQDRAAVGRVLANLVGNAIKFTERGGITVRLRREGAFAVIEVEDTGIGISPEFLPRLFGEFTQESTGVSRRHEGNGLGLTISKRLTDLMEGTIRVSSTRGSGSLFTVHLPLGTPVEEPDQRTAEMAGASQGQRILAVDDMPEIRLLIPRMLSGLFDVDTAAGPDEALEKARRTRFDAVLLDINLGDGQDGIGVLHALRALPDYRTTPIIACTAYVLPGDEQRLRASGFDGYASKPLRKAELLSLLAGFVPNG